MIADAVAEGLLARSASRKNASEDSSAVEPLAEWERELLEGEVAADESAAEAVAEESEKPAQD